MKTLIGKNLGQTRKSVNPIGCLKRASDKQCLSMRKPALVRRKTVCNIYGAARYCRLKHNILQPFFIIIFFFAFKHYETDNKHSPALSS